VCLCTDDIWPLRLVDLKDDEQFSTLYDLLGRLPQVVYHYLSTFVFPETMRHQGLKLSASGQDLGGEMLFGRRLGFSGTPSDLLPVELGRCEYEKGSDGKMINFFTSAAITSFALIGTGAPGSGTVTAAETASGSAMATGAAAGAAWSPRSLLKLIATTTSPTPYHALIDTGALITGMTNYEVAAYLLDEGLTGMDGVVFLDEDDRQMILLRHNRRVVKLSECGVARNRRFSFYDRTNHPLCRSFLSSESTRRLCVCSVLRVSVAVRVLAQRSTRQV
jgi:hypothetical protein